MPDQAMTDPRTLRALAPDGAAVPLHAMGLEFDRAFDASEIGKAIAFKPGEGRRCRCSA